MLLEMWMLDVRKASRKMRMPTSSGNRPASESPPDHAGNLGLHRELSVGFHWIHLSRCRLDKVRFSAGTNVTAGRGNLETGW
jgi:hypothetical protein